MTEDTEPVPTGAKTPPTKTPAILAAGIAIGFFGAFGALLVVPLPGDSKEALFLMIGALIAAFSTVVGFYYGSSSSAKTKDDTINSLTKNGGTT